MTPETKCCGNCRWYHKPKHLIITDGVCEIPANYFAHPYWLEIPIDNKTRSVPDTYVGCKTFEVKT